MNVADYYDQYIQKLQQLYELGEAQSIANWVFQDVLLIKAHHIKLLNKDIYGAEEQILESILQRLLLAEPLQYILGYTWFYGQKFAVSPDVLIPRNETEELVDLIVETLKKEHPNKPLKVLDIGTGSACIAISLQMALPAIHTSAVDLSEEALAIAQKNAHDLNVSIDFSLEDILSISSTLQSKYFDVIVSNPPYILPAEREGMDANVKVYEPSNALFVTNNDPLQFYKAIANYAATNLLPSGFLFFEIHQDYGQITTEMLESKGFLSVQCIKDINANNRIVSARKA